MPKVNSFDIVSKTDYSEVKNAINQTRKEISQRFDFKGSKALIELHNDNIILSAEDETKMKNMREVLETKLVRRSVSLKALETGKIEPSAGGTVRQLISIQQGIPTEKAKEIVKLIKREKLKVQSSIQGDSVRVAAKKRDDLQKVISLLRKKELGIDMQFTNYR